jgi:hypothetical protein
MLRLSTKQKREVYSLSNLLLHLFIFIALLIALNSCGLINREKQARLSPFNTCASEDLQGPGGCRAVLAPQDTPLAMR